MNDDNPKKPLNTIELMKGIIVDMAIKNEGFRERMCAHNSWLDEAVEARAKKEKIEDVEDAPHQHKYMTITSEDLDLYMDDFIATLPEHQACDYRLILGIVSCFDSQQFVEEIAMGDDTLYNLYLDARAYIEQRIANP